jgi:hypothetical protein
VCFFQKELLQMSENEVFRKLFRPKDDGRELGSLICYISRYFIFIQAA